MLCKPKNAQIYSARLRMLGCFHNQVANAVDHYLARYANVLYDLPVANTTELS